MAPSVLPAAWTLVGAVIGAAVTVAWQSTRREHRDCNLFLPRFFLIIALQENLEKLRAAVPDDLEDFCKALTKILIGLREILKARGENRQWPDAFKSNIDNKLVKCLQKVAGGSSILEGYLPNIGQTWDALLNENAEGQIYVLNAESNQNELQKDLASGCLFAVDSLLRDLELIGNPNKEIVRSQYQVSQVEPVVEVIPFTVVKVFYATDRQITEDGEYIGKISERVEHGLSTDSSSSANGGKLSPLQFGVAEIGIPDKHEPGKQEAPCVYEESSPLNHVVIFSMDTKMRANEREFMRAVNSELTTNEHELLIYIHGYNVGHKGALKRAAQLKYDLQFKGAIIAYSWSSKNDLKEYPHDQRTVKETISSLKSFLLYIMHEVEAPRIHILAHSMGNRALIGALDMLYEEQKDPGLRPCRLSQIIFAAADERRSEFEKVVVKMGSSGLLTPNANRCTADDSRSSSTPKDAQPHLTVYCSTDDWALTLSRLIHGEHRLGDTRSFLASKKDVDHDVVDATGMDNSFLRHSYYGDVPQIIEDIKILLQNKKAAKDRGNLSMVELKKRRYYVIRREELAQ